MQTTDSGCIEEERFELKTPFEEKALETITDLICSRIVDVTNSSKKPTECVSCNHVFCFGCFQDLLKKKKNCPYCREPLKTQPLHRSIQNLVSELNVKCRYYKNGCSFITALRNVSSHEKECKFKIMKIVKEPEQKPIIPTPFLNHESNPTTIFTKKKEITFESTQKSDLLECKQCTALIVKEDILQVPGCGHNFCIYCVRDMEPENHSRCFFQPCSTKMNPLTVAKFLADHDEETKIESSFGQRIISDVIVCAQQNNSRGDPESEACSLCQVPFFKSDLYSNQECCHRYCIYCIKDYINSSLPSNCLLSHCKSKLDSQELLTFIRKKD